ncbi:MAG: ribonuclease D [Gammaproteobacteria bacterium]|nr:ribonuclease D [Gammaproteobacteria bacterium]
MQSTLYIDTDSALSELCQQLKAAPYIALDTEFIREKTYSAHLCLIQIATGDIIACVDPIKLDNIDALMDVLYDRNIIKIFHAARQDLEIFFDMRGSIPGPIFDSQIAATLLGQSDQIGYANLVNALLNVELDKGQSRTDWSRRPLDEAQLRYAADDVRYLLQLYPIIINSLKEQDRLNWLDDDFVELENPSLYELHPEVVWKKVSGHNRLKGVQLAVVKQLAGWREQQALKRDRPRKWIIADDVITTLARIAPTKPAELEKIRGLTPQTIKHDGDALLEEIEKGKNLPKDQWPEIKFKKATLNQECMTDILMASLRMQCKQHGISPAIISNRKELEKMAMGERELPVLQGWRKHIAGDTLLDILDGKLFMKVMDNQVKFIPAE